MLWLLVVLSPNIFAHAYSLCLRHLLPPLHINRTKSRARNVLENGWRNGQKRTKKRTETETRNDLKTNSWKRRSLSNRETTARNGRCYRIKSDVIQEEWDDDAWWGASASPGNSVWVLSVIGCRWSDSIEKMPFVESREYFWMLNPFRQYLYCK